MAEPAGDLGETTPWPLVARAEELDRFAAALAGPTCRGVVIHGSAGVGKTRLADECLAVARSAGRVTGRAGATTGMVSVPLGALVHLLPSTVLDHRFDPVALYAEVLGELQRRSPDEPFVLFVDDLHVLDSTSATLLGQLLDAAAVFLVGTVRTGEPLLDPVARLWRRDHVLRFDLSELTPDGIDTLLHLTLGGPVEAGLVSGIWAASQGNALFVRELILGAQAAGNLAEERGVWGLRGPLVSTARLIDAVEARIGQISGDARSVLELLALWEPVGLRELEALAGLEALERLEHAGLISVRADGRRQLVTLGHPLYGDALRHRLPALSRRRLLLAQADRVGARGARRRDDPLRIATAQVEATGSADPDLLVAAARLARYAHDHPNVERLARAALVERATSDAVLLLAEALHEQGAYTEAEVVLGDADGTGAVADEPLAVQLVSLRVRNLVFGLHRQADALEMNRNAQRRFTGRDSHNDLIADEGIVLLYSNRPADVLAALDRVTEDRSPRTRVLCALSEATALTLTGRCETALQVAGRALREHRALGDQLAIAHADIHLVYRMHALTEAGRLADAVALATAGHAGASRGGPPLGRVWFSGGLGRTAILTGQPRTAHRWLTEAARLCRTAGFDGPRRVVLALLAMAAAWLGEADEAAAAVAELDGLEPFGYSRGEQELGRAWAAVAAGEPERARAVLRAAADAAAETGHRAAEAWMLHDVARLGEPRDVADRLEELGRQCEGDLVAAYARHARALAGRQPEALDEASRRFEAMGANLLAAEAATAAGHAYRRAGEPRSATRVLSRATTLIERCQGARTPGLVNLDGVVPLSPREREIAVLAAQRMPSKDIAERLFVSSRTVENHLHRIYTKLGVTSRAGLAAALGEDGADQ